MLFTSQLLSTAIVSLALVTGTASAQFSSDLPVCVSKCLVRIAREGGYTYSAIESGKLSALCTNENFPSAFDRCLQDTCEKEENKSNGMSLTQKALGCAADDASSSVANIASSVASGSSAVESGSSTANSTSGETTSSRSPISSKLADAASSVASKVSSEVEQATATGSDGAPPSESGTSDASNVKLGLSSLFLVGGAVAIVGI